ncbi:MAG: serine/threonine-protein kinase [Myxococcota bacterium]
MAIRKVGDCRILGPLGKGGMAQVYRGLHEGLQREVAIKELSPDAAKNSEQLSRFKRESMALAGFRHQHIVTLYDLIEKNDGLYMVMELVDGPTLSELIKESPLPPDAVAVIGLQLASALEHAHFHRVVHRDLKPGNVMISSWGDVKLMDFGIAQQEDLDRLTRAGMAVGTPAYMSPEQVTGGQVDARSDIYSLGVMLYEALSGKRPFSGANPGEVFARVTAGKKEAPLARVAPKAPKSLVSIIEKAMARDPDKRFADATALRKAFQELLARIERSPSAVLVAFLRSRNRLSESEVLARLSHTELTQLSQLSPQELAVVRRPRWGLALAFGVLLGVAISSFEQWWPRLEQVFANLRH